ncbi:MAG: ABC transporter substrate-binding protein [Acutalibacteraceae bacterium]|nr:ABC transporter substrate-binding protein [Acutalibacteraceae bacterium]
MNNKIIKVLSLILSVVFITSVFASCSSDKSKKETGNTDKVNLAIMRTGFTLPLYYAVQQGYFEELGLDVDVQYFDNGPQVNEAIASGDIDIAGIGQMPSITGAIANKSKIVAWMEDDEESIQAYARNDSDIVKLGKGNVEGYEDIYGDAETWKGKEVICAKGTSSHYGLLATLNALGLTEKDIKIINMEGAQGATAFASGTGDIFFGFDPQWSEFYSNSDKYTCISTCAAAGKSLYAMLIASNDFYTNKSDIMVKFMEGLLKAEEELRADENKYYDEMYNWQSFYGNCTKEIAKYSASIKKIRSLDEQKEMFTESDGTSEVLKSYETVIDFMVKNEVIKEADKQTFYDNNSIDPSYMFEAIENLNK